jgi:Tripartite tricarboxylate transporter family receptor
VWSLAGRLALPAKTPRAIVDWLHAETQKALAVPAVQGRLATFGVEPMPMTRGKRAGPNFILPQCSRSPWSSIREGRPSD